MARADHNADHHFVSNEHAATIVERALGTPPQSVSRQSLTLSGNTVFRAVLADGRSIVLRVSPESGVFGYTQMNLTALRLLGLPVQTVLARGPTDRNGSFIILNWIPGRDLMYELPTMSREQLARLARTITDFQLRAALLPASSGFGWASIGQSGPSARWIDIFGGADVSPVLPIISPLDQLRARLRALKRTVEPHFTTLQPVCFLDDLTTKNVLIENGELTGIIDIDTVCYGDPLMSVGTTLALLAADVGEAGRFYGEELVRCWNPTADQQRAIHFYAVLWMIGLVTAAEAAGESARASELMTITDGLLREAEARDESNASTEQRLELATARHRAGDLSAARSGYQHVLVEAPDLALAQFRLGLLELQEGHLDAALNHVQRAANSSPTEVRYQCGLAKVFLAMRRPEEAVEACRRALRIDPDSADAHNALEVALRSQQESA
jgi:aminoglycoside phosphotransferase (APT) family kinase protein